MNKRIMLPILLHVILVLLAIASVYPAIWIVLSSFKEGTSLYSETIIPRSLTLEHYKNLFSDQDFDFRLYYWNTLKIAVLSMLFGTAIQIMTAYSLSRFRFTGRKTLLSGMLIMGMFPGFMSIIAVFVILNELKLLNTHFAMVLVYSSGAALGSFIAKGFFDTIPRSIEESARIDGASHFKVFTHIMLPLSRPIITFVALTSFAGAWVDFIFAKMVLRKNEVRTVAIALFELINTQSSTKFTLFAAGCVLVALPITLLFIYLQRFLVDGLTAGADKF
ncbi:sugar ABC transporter permease [Cohnella faecalis]|uniref:sugar ABC transporter permease n=1 Tax=Cohnella faecalis TaxID=2315694 RepID=UPI003613F0B0